MALVHVEVDVQNEVLRVIRSTAEAMRLPAERTRQVERAEAVGAIRRFVFNRAGGVLAAQCEWCGAPVTWESGHMHEKRFKGRGGEVGRDNCVFICSGCHIGRPDSAHGDRRWQSAVQEIPEGFPPDSHQT